MTSVADPKPTPALPPPDHRAQVQFGIYKYGQGYWVRVMTAVMGGLLLLASVLWLNSQIAAYIVLPTKDWTVPCDSVRSAEGKSPAVGDKVMLQRPNSLPDQPAVDVASGVITGYNAARKEMTVSQVVAAGEREVIEAELVKGPSYVATIQRASMKANPIFDVGYLSFGVCVVVGLLGVGAVYWFVCRKQEAVEFLIATDGEMKKVNWSTPKEVMGSTWVVIIASVLIAAFIFGADSVISAVMRALDVLKQV